MISSGTKRGLAYGAVTALAVTGLPFMAGSANAEPLSSQVPTANSVRLVNPDNSNVVSSKPDGQNSTYRLQAIAGSNLSHVRFQYDLSTAGDNWVTIATVDTRNDDGSFSYEWNPDALGAQTGMRIRAVGFYIDNNAEMVNAIDVFSNATINDTVSSVNLNDGSAKGYFVRPYVLDGATGSWTIFDGTVSDGGPINVRHWDNGFSGWTSYPTASGVFKGIYNIAGFSGLAFGPPDHLLLQAQNGSSDTESYSMYEQQIETVTAVAANTNSPSETVTVTVKDQNGNPIAGAQVLSSAASSPIKYTDANGQATFTQNVGAPNDVFYYANGNDTNAFEPNTLDRRSDVVQVRNYEAHAASLTATSRNGAAFDRDELDNDFWWWADSDIRVQVKDQMGKNYDPSNEQNLTYFWYIIPFNTALEPIRVPGVSEDTVTAETAGEFEVNVPTNQPDGTYELHAGLTGTFTNDFPISISKLLTVKMGDSNIVFDKASPQRSTSGGAEVVSGRLRLADGTGLPGRPLNASVTYAGPGNSKFDMATGPDLASKDVVTDANGAFSVTLDDPDSNPPSTEKADVKVQTTNWTHNFDTDNANENNTQRVEFIFNAVPAQFTSEITSGDGATSGDRETAGEKVAIEYTLFTPDDPNMQGDQSRLLTNEPVTLTTTNGYFTNAGNANLGTEETYVTDANGKFTAYLVIARDAGFDDDGRVDATVTATAAGAVTDTQMVYFTSENPLSLSKVDVAFAGPQWQTTTNLPKAQAKHDQVKLLVEAYDGFGNRVGNQSVQLTDSTIQADVTNAVTDYNDQPDATATANSGVDQTIRAAAAGQEDLITINWYDVVVTNATVTMVSSATDGNATVGETVTETVTVVDQFGQPVEGYTVEFVRHGPNPQVGDVNYTTSTDANGVATYNFEGDHNGTAEISAVVRNLAGTQVAKVFDTVVFSGGPRPNLNPVLRGNNNGAADDLLTVKTNNSAAEGVRVRLFSIRNGKRFFLASGTLGPKGNKSFRVDDQNGNKRTKYIAKIIKTATSNGQFTNTKRVR